MFRIVVHFAAPPTTPIPRIDPTDTCVVETGRPNRDAPMTRAAVTRLPVSPCPGGPRQCFADAGPGLYSCAPTDAGVTHVVTDGGLPCPRSNTALTCGGATPYCSIITGTPTCVADGGAQCWYPSQCPSGNGCYAGVTASFFNICQPGPTSDNPVALCDDSLDGGDCAPGFGCTGVFYGFRACQAIAGFDGGLIDAGSLVLAGLLAPAMLLGSWLGGRAFALGGARCYRPASLAFLVAIAATALLQALRAF